MTTSVHWTVNADGDWDTAADWSSGQVPDSADNVTISTSSFHTITHDAGNDTVNALTVGNDAFVLSGGNLTVLTTASFAHAFDQSGGTLSATTVSVHGGVFTGGSVTGTTTLTANGPTTIGNYTIAGAAVFNALGTTSETGQVTLGDATGANAALGVAAGGHYNIAGDYGIGANAASATVQNAGTLAKTSGTGTSTIAANLVSTGTLSIDTGGTLAIGGASNSIAGTVTGQGTLEVVGGQTTLTVGTIAAASVELTNGAGLTLGTNTTLGGVFTEFAYFGSPVLNLGGYTLSIGGAGSSIGGFEGGSTIDGGGTLANSGSLTVADLTFGGTDTLYNTGTISQTGGFTLGDSSGAQAGIVNAAGAVYQFTQALTLAINSNPAETFTNAGTIETAASSGTSDIALNVTSASGATILAATGSTLTFSNGLSNAGTITGAGDVQLVSSASGTLAAGTSLTAAEFDVTGNATLTLATSLAYAGIFTEEANFGRTTLALGANTLTLSGASNAVGGFEGSSTIQGAGELINSGTLSLADLTFGGTMVLDNTGLVNQAGGVTLGDGNGNVATIDNAAGAHWVLANTSGLGEGASSLSTFQNYGTLDVTPGDGNDVTVSATLANEKGGTLTVGEGVMQLSSGLHNNGLITGGTLQLINSAALLLNTGTALTGAELDVLDNATLTANVSLTYHGSFTEGASFGRPVIALNKHNLTLSGPVSFTAFEGGNTVNGTGTLSTTGTTQLANLTVGGTATYSNTGTILATGSLQVGDGSSAAAHVVNAAKGVFDIVNDNAGIGMGASMASAFTNNGLFEKTSGSGTNVVSSHFINDGTITVTSGTIEFTAGSLVNNGTINGVMTTDNQGDVFITHS